MDSPELSAKYQTLAAEYSKIRAQNQVLKRAIIEEQQKVSKQNELLQSLRRAEQENDSLNFRNQQLTCRLSLLQDDLQKLQQSQKSGHRKTGSNSSVNSVKTSTLLAGSDAIDVDILMQELQAKISENASLHARVSELELQLVQHERDSSSSADLNNKLSQITSLCTRNDELNSELRHAMEALELHERTAKAKIEQLENEKMSKDIEIQQQVRHIAKLKQRLIDAKVTPPITPVHSSFATANITAVGQFAGSGSTLASPSSVSSSSSYFSLATCSTSQDVNRDQTLKNPILKLNLASKTYDGLNTSFHFTEQDVKLSCGFISEHSKDLCYKFKIFIEKYCKYRQSKLTPVSLFGEVAVDLQKDKDLSQNRIDDNQNKALDTINKVLQGTEYWDKLAPLLEDVTKRTLTDEDCAINGSDAFDSSLLTGSNLNSSASSSISAITASTLAHLRLLATIPCDSTSFQSSLRSVQSCWSAVLPYLSALASNTHRISHGSATLTRLVSLLSDRCANLSAALNDAVTKFQSTEVPEHDNHTYHGSPREVLESLQQLSVASHELTYALKSRLKLGIGKELNCTSAESTSSNLGHERHFSSGSVVTLTGNEPVSTLCMGASINLQTGGATPPSPSSLISSLEESQLSSTNSPLSNSFQSNNAIEAKLNQLHRQKEHWRLEYHLLSHKYNKLNKILSGRKAHDATDIDSEQTVKRGSCLLKTSIVGEVKIDEKVTAENNSNTQNADGDISWRESMIRHHLSSRLSKQYVDTCLAASQALLFQDESISAVQRLKYCEQQRLNLENDLQEVRSEKSRLAEELRITCSNYEEQISAMSDHLADVNEKLACHEDHVAMQRSQKMAKK